MPARLLLYIPSFSHWYLPHRDCSAIPISFLVINLFFYVNANSSCTSLRIVGPVCFATTPTSFHPCFARRSPTRSLLMESHVSGVSLSQTSVMALVQARKSSEADLSLTSWGGTTC